MIDKPKFKKVMIIDDNKIDLYITSRIIKNNHFGSNVVEFSSATEALAYLQDHKGNIAQLPEMIFVDIYMPIMSGFEFMMAYDKLPEALKNHCTVYIISSSIDEADIAQATNDKNVVAFREKPITKEFLENIEA